MYIVEITIIKQNLAMSLINIHVHNWQLLLSLTYSTCWQSIASNNVVIRILMMQFVAALLLMKNFVVEAFYN